jgi:ribosomal protein S18 acetylase RimI-like enzyme
MKSAFVIEDARTPEDVASVERLVREYAASLPVDLGYQDFDDELLGFPGKYAGPGGALLLARTATGAAIGCVALRPLDGSTCEMKRLYVAPEGRGLGAGLGLVRALIARAAALGYDAMVLDTLPSMKRAVGLYEALGFRPCAPYYVGAPPGTLYLRLDLGKPS